MSIVMISSRMLPNTPEALFPVHLHERREQYGDASADLGDRHHFCNLAGKQ